MYKLQALQTNGTWYTISEHATVTAAEDAMRSRPAWRADWGKQNFAQWEWRYKNGKPKYHLRDLDHGTTREQGAKVLRVDPA